MELTVTSAAFAEGGTIPATYCADDVAGALNTSPPLAWSEPPAATRSLVVAMVDHHPVASMWVHWIVVGVPPSTTSLAEGASGALASPAVELKNTFGNPRYDGPRPPAGSGDHAYVVTVYALDIDQPEIPAEPSSADIGRAVDGHVLAQGSLTGVFGR